MTITQTVEIPTNHRLTIDVPREIPAGKVQVEFKVIPFPKKEEKADSLKASLKKMRELCKDAPISVDSFLEMRREDLELEEAKYRRLFGEGN